MVLITLRDKAPPEITIPAMDLVVECDGGGNQAEYQAWLDSHGGASAFDDCSGGGGGAPIMFAYTGAVQQYVVPAGVTSVTIESWGAQGSLNSASTGSGGQGGFASGELTVTPGEVLEIYVGGADGFNGGGEGRGVPGHRTGSLPPLPPEE